MSFENLNGIHHIDYDESQDITIYLFIFIFFQCNAFLISMIRHGGDIWANHLVNYPFYGPTFNSTFSPKVTH